MSQKHYKGMFLPDRNRSPVGYSNRRYSEDRSPRGFYNKRESHHNNEHGHPQHQRKTPTESTYDRPYIGRYSKKYDSASSYTPSKAKTETAEKPALITAASSTPRSERSDAPTDNTTGSSSSSPAKDLAPTSTPPISSLNTLVKTPSRPSKFQWNTEIDLSILVDCHSFEDGKLRPDPESSHIEPPTVTDHKSKTIRDPRSNANFKSQLQNMKRYNKVPYKSLALTKFSYDKNSLGPPPPNEIIINGLSSSTSDAYIINQLKLIGKVEKYESILDPSTGVPLGMLRVKFGESPDKAFHACKKAIKDLNQTKIDGNTINVILNLNDNVFQQTVNKEIESKVTRIKLAEIEDKKIILPSAPKAILNAISRQNAIREAKVNKFAARAEARAAAIAAIKAKEEQKLSNNETKSIEIPADLQKYIKGRAFIFISSKYIKGTIGKNEIKKALEIYDWARILEDEAGIFIVFNKPRDAKRCFNLEDGKLVHSINLYMQLQLPDGYQPNEADDNYALQERDVMTEATLLLTKELETALQKDIRSKIIAPAILKFLDIKNFPHLKTVLQPPAPPTINLDKSSINDTIKSEVKDEDTSIDVFSLYKKIKIPKLPSFRKSAEKDHSKLKGKVISPKKRKLLPMNYKLNFQDDYDSDNKDSNRSTPQPDELEEPPKKKSKKLVFNDDQDQDEEMADVKTRHAEPHLYSSSSEDEDEEPIVETKESLPTTPEEDKMDIDSKDNINDDDEEKEEESYNKQEIDHSIFDRSHQPVVSELPITVYEEVSDNLLLDIDGFQQLIKDNEDFELMKEILSEEVETPRALSYPTDYWCWKTKFLKKERKLNTEKSAIIIPANLENTTGSYRSQGYSKIPDEVKVDYLPHRKRVHDPLNTIQVDNEEVESSKVQSSRANRSNNRRFASEVSNFNTENELLSMNQLNKRKKPVSFARSAIHNWGLYALEPIAGREMIIEYVGERIRQQVADFREKAYLKSGIGSSYLFRVDENTVIDATKKGGIARFINHSCVPSCTAKIIKVEGQKRIVIYALRDIAANEELTYDYKFERETNDNERVRCLCGAPGCKGYLN